MFTLALQRRFEARHHLIGANWGAENKPHTHLYLLELRLEGSQLNKHGYLVDLMDVERHLDQTVQIYKGTDLNELPEFAGLNPSLEHFARILAQNLAQRLAKNKLNALSVQLWENESAWASYRLEL